MQKKYQLCQSYSYIMSRPCVLGLMCMSIAFELQQGLPCVVTNLPKPTLHTVILLD